MTQRRRWIVTFVGWGLYFSFAFSWFALPALLPNVRMSVHLSSFATGVLLGSVAGVIATTWMVMGPLVDWIGPDVALGVGVLSTGVAAALRGAANGFPLLFGSMVVLALGGSTVTYGLPRAISSWFADEEVGTPIGIVTVGAQFGSLVAFGSMQSVATFFGGWRIAFVVSGVPAVIFGIAWLLVGGRGPHFEPSDLPDVDAIRLLFTRPAILALVVAGFTYLFATHGLFGWLSTLLTRRGLDAGRAARLVAVLSGGQILGTLGFPVLSDRFGRRGMLVGLAGTGLALGPIGFAVLPTRVTILAVVGVVTGLALGAISPLLRILPIKIVPQSQVSTVVSMIFGVGAIGGFLGPVSVGVALGSGIELLGFGVLALPGFVLVGVGTRLAVV